MPYKNLTEFHSNRHIFDMRETSIANGENWIGIVVEDQAASNRRLVIIYLLISIVANMQKGGSLSANSDRLSSNN